MNRAQRRAKNRVEKRKISVKDAHKIAATTAKEAVHVAKEAATANATDILQLAVMLVLHDKYGFGEKRMTDFSRYLFTVIEAIAEQRITLEDIDAVLMEEVYKSNPPAA